MGISPQRIGKYELQERLGRGGMAEVWKALDTQLGRLVAIKILHPDLQNNPNFLTRFEREAQVIASLHHPNIVQIYDFHISRPTGSGPTVAYMVMDYVEGQTMAQYLHTTSRAGKFPSPSDLIHLFTPICLAVDYAHQKGMIHRDLKPSNILLDRRSTANNPIGEPILSDFGIAKLLGTTTSVLSGWGLGTPSYISPEQVSGSPGNELSDIYALSVILYEACTGTLPFQGDNPTAIMMQHVNGIPLSPTLINPHIPPALATMILRGLAKAPGGRFPSASTLAIALAEALNIPAPENVRQMAYQINEMHSPTYISPIRPPHTPVLPPAGSALSGMGTTFMAPSLQQAEPVSYPSRPVSLASAALEPQHLTLPPLPPSTEKGRGRRIITSILLALLFVGASLGTLALLTYKPPPTAGKTVGHAFFINSGQLNPDNSQGINDQLLIDLRDIPDPSPGKAYYGWLLGDKSLSESPTTPLGLLTVDHGNIHMLYQGNKCFR